MEAFFGFVVVVVVVKQVSLFDEGMVEYFGVKLSMCV